MKYLTENKYWEIDKEYNINKLLYLLIDRPDYINWRNEFFWNTNKNQYHRNYDFPSIIWDDSIFWYRYDLIHRENNKPATIKSNGHKDYWVNSKFIKEEKL